MISATANTSSSSSVGLAISYSRNGEDTSLDEDDRQYHLQQQRRHRLSEDPRLYSEDDEDAETFEDSRYTDNGNQTHNIERLDRRYDYRNGDEEISGSEYETEDQDGTDYDSQSDHYEEEERVVYPLQKSRARSSNSKHAHQPVPLSPRMQQHIVVQPVSAKPVIAKASSRAPLMSASMQRTTSSDNSNASTAQQNRYGAYYRPSAGMTSSPAMSVSTPKMHSSPSLVPATSSSLAKSSSSTYRSSPVLNSPRLPALSSSSLSSSSPKPTFSTPSTPSNHLSLASQMRRERQASSNALHTSNLESQSPNLNAVRREQIQKRRSKERVRADQRYQIQKRQQREEDYSPPSIQQQRQNESLKNSESMETVYVVQRAQRVPVVRRV